MTVMCDARSVAAGRMHAGKAQQHASRSREQAAALFDACTAAVQTGEPLNVEQVKQLALEVTESSFRAFLNARAAVGDLTKPDDE